MSERSHRLWRAVTLLGLIALWQAVCSAGFVSELLVASPLSVLRWLARALPEGEIWHDAVVTLKRVLVAFGISAIIAVPLGVAMGWSEWLGLALEFPVDFGRSIPATVLFPIFLIFFGVGEGSRIACAVYGATLIILMSAMSGVRQANAVRMQAARLYGARGWRLLAHVLVPEALPSILTGFRLGASLSFVIVVLVEMFVGTSAGLGHRMIEAQVVYEVPELYGLVIVTGILGYLLNQVFVLLERRLCHYVGRG